jgi:hypothetical protein
VGVPLFHLEWHGLRQALVNPELLATPEIPSSQFAHPRLGEK